MMSRVRFDEAAPQLIVDIEVAELVIHRARVPYAILGIDKEFAHRDTPRTAVGRARWCSFKPA